MYSSEERCFQQAYEQGQQALHQFENQVNSLAADTALINKIKEGSLSTAEFTSLHNRDYLIYLYANDSLIFWNNNKVLPEVSYDDIAEGGQLLKKKNGYYFGISKSIGQTKLVGLQLIKTSYPIVNNYLKNSFSPAYPFDEKLEISAPDTSKTHTFYTTNEKPAFSILHEASKSSKLNIPSLVIGLLAVIAFWLLVWLIIIYFNKQYKAWAAYLFLLGASVIFIELIEFVDFEFKKGIVFSPQLYASQYYGRTLGHLFVHASIVFFFNVLIAFQYFSRNWTLKLWQIALFGLFAFIQLVAYHEVVKSMILDSIISFEINNFTLITPYTFLGLSIISLLTASLFISLYLTVHALRNKFHAKTWLMILGLSLIAMLVLYVFGFGILALVFPVIFFVHSLLYLLFTQSPQLQRFALLLNAFFFAALMITSILKYYNQENETNLKEIAANQLAESRDLITEYQFEEVQQAIKEDPFFRKFFVSPFVSQSELQQRLNYLYFGGYLSKYNVRSTAFNLEGNALKTNTSLQLNDYYAQIALADSTFSKSLFLLPQEDGKNKYLSVLPIENDGKVSGTLVLELSPKTFTKENLYPELLIEQKSSPIAQLSPSKDYEYAIYRQGALVNQSGEYAYPYKFESLIKGKGDAEIPTAIETPAFKLNLFQVDQHTIVVINEAKGSLLQAVSTFSYIFFFLTLLGLITTVLIYLINNRLNILPLRPIRLTFKNKINLAVALITVASFVVIAFVTIGYFSGLSKENNTNKLIAKQQSILSSLEYTISSNTRTLNGISPANLSTELATLAEQQNIDINLFTLDGSLALSSQPGVFGNGLVSRKIDPMALHHLIQLEEERYIQEEAIGSLQYQSIYVPVRLKTGEAIGILNLPYFAQQKTIRKELSKLMVALLNVYVLLLIISIFIAFVISNSITRPLAKISNKMALIEFGSANERIEWESSDEIGALVDEYNKMITQIEESASTLAQSERESAWREMARQIAHEIKNPLTPMKLSIQHLQRAIKSDPERVEELAERVSRTMVEQIDNLSEIATAFSSFAKMPKANKEQVNLIEVLKNVISLFNPNAISSIEFQHSVNEAWIYADKNQLISVFNNLVKNAQQAIEDMENGHIEIRIEEQGDNYLVAVEDNGVGIAAEQKNKVFVPNFTTKSSGTGLGLAISKQIVENSEGAIWFESEQNKGSTFFVTFPKSKRTS